MGPKCRNTNDMKKKTSTKKERKNNNNITQVFTFITIPFKQGFAVCLPASVLFLELCQ